MNKGYLLLVVGLIVVLAGSSVADITAQAEGNAEWLPIKSWKWDKEKYETKGQGTPYVPFTATITFENAKAETATITSLTMNAGWTTEKPTWGETLTIEPGATGTIEISGNIPPNEDGDRSVSLVGIVKFDGTEYEITWLDASTLRIEQQTGIPGFPTESIALGLLGAIIVLFAKRGIPLPKSRFQ